MSFNPGDFRYDTPTASPFQDFSQYVALLVGLIEQELERADVWNPDDLDVCLGYMEDLKAFIQDLPDVVGH